MTIHSPSIRLDVALARITGEVCDRGEYVAVKTPSNPTYYWGNYLVFPAAPGKGDLARWQEVFRMEFTYYDEIKNMVFVWDYATPERGDTHEFEEAGFRFDASQVLIANQVVVPPKFNREIEVRELTTDDDFEAIVRLDMDYAAEEGGPSAWSEDFARRRVDSYRKLIGAGKGFWFGTFSGERLVGEVGFFHDGPVGVVRRVTTHPEFRRRGICGRVVYDAVKHAMGDLGIKTVLVEADPDYHAIGIYESMGFKRAETIYSLEWVKKK